MKKVITALVCAAIIFSVSIPVRAFDIFYQRLTPPELSQCTFTGGEKPCVDVAFTSALSDAELVRKATYDAILDFIGSEEKLLSSEYSYLAYETRNFCQVSSDGTDWYTVTVTAENSGTLRLSYYSDILTALILGGADIPGSTGECTFYVRIITASENLTDKNAKSLFTYAVSEAVSFEGSAYSYVHFILPEDASLTAQSLVISSSPADKNTELYPSSGDNRNFYIPSRGGYLFDGWSYEGDKRTGVIPAGKTAVTLTSHWIPVEYEINYVLTTRFGYPFGRADNSDNPTGYTTDKTVAIYDIATPVIGFTFGGWYLTNDFSGERVTEIKEGTTGDIVLYAKWISDEETAAELKARREEYIREKHFGDLDGDFRVTAADARLVLRASVELENLGTEILRRADYNNSGKISANNARTTLRISVGLDSLYDILLENGMLDSIT